MLSEVAKGPFFELEAAGSGGYAAEVCKPSHLIDLNSYYIHKSNIILTEIPIRDRRRLLQQPTKTAEFGSLRI